MWIRLIIFIYLRTLAEIFVAAQFSRTPVDQKVCVGADVTLDWRFDHENDLDSAQWYRDSTNIMTMIGSAQANAMAGITNVHHITNGAIKITGVSLEDGGQYICSISYTLGSGLGFIPADSVNVTVLDPPSVPSYRITVSGQESTYHCEINSTGRPAVEVKIKIGGLLQTGSSSIVDYTKPVDCCVVGDASACIAGNTNNAAEYCKNAITPSGPNNIELHPERTTYILNVGELLGSVVCSATCVPTCSFSWTRDTQTISNNGTLKLSIQNKNERGTYTCTATRGTTITKTKNITVYVRYGPESVSFNPAGPLFVKNKGEQLSVRCISSCYPSCSYTWTKQGQSETVSMTDALYLSNIQTSYAGSYTCTVNYNGVATTVSKTANLRVRYGPDSVSLNPAGPSFVKNKGEQLSVHCISNCYPSCSYTWTKQGQSGTVSTNDTLYLSNLQTSHFGSYTCTVRNTYDGIANTKNKTITLNVRYGPDSVTFNPAGPSFIKNVGEQLTVLCISSCYPSCSYTWTKQGQSGTMSTSDTLDLSNIKTHHAGTYTCTVRNTYDRITTQKTKSVMLNVRYGPEIVSLTPNGETHTIDEFHHLGDILCYADCYPPCTYVWTKQGQSPPASTNARLSFGNRVPREYAGVYNCTATNSNLNKHQSVVVTVHIRYGPDKAILTPSTTSYTLNVGSLFPGISCTSDCYPQCSNIWHKQGGSNSIATTNGLLELGILDKTEAGVYICNVTNVPFSKSLTVQVTLQIRYGPDTISFQPDTNNTSAVEGSALPEITCTSECYPGCSETWWNVTRNTQQGNGNTLSLGTVYRYYTGAYNCSSKNQADDVFRKTLNRSVYLTVQYFPDVNIYKVGDGDTSELDFKMTIECTAKGEPEAMFYNITHLSPNGVKVRDLQGSKEREKLVVDFNSLSIMDSGIYICTVTNGIKNYVTDALNATDEVGVVVKGKPYISDPKTIIDVPVGGNASLKVSFYSNDGSEPGIKWVRVMDDSEIELSNSQEEDYHISTFPDDVIVSYYKTDVEERGKTTQLTIDNVKAEDFKAYTVIINNSIGSTNHTIALAARGSPEEPYNFAVVDESKTTSSITLTWNSGFDGGADQTFHILYKTNITQWQEWLPVVDDKKMNAQFIETVSHLDQGTLYFFKIYANNTYGQKYSGMTIYAMTSAITATEEPSSITAAAAGGGVGGAVVILAVIFGVVFVKRRSSKKDPKDDVRKLSSDNNRKKENDDDEEVANPMYESAGDLPTTSNNNLYAVVDKSKKPSPEDKNLYAVVDKSKNNKKKVQESELYSFPVKKAKDAPNKKEKPKKEKGKQKQKKKGKTEDNNDGLVYENAKSVNIPSQENVYENPSCSTVDEDAKPKSLSRTKNPDGLIYLEVEVPKTKDTTGRKLIIHGLEDRSDYADIAFGKVGEPAPESDEEKEQKE